MTEIPSTDLLAETDLDRQPAPVGLALALAGQKMVKEQLTWDHAAERMKALLRQTISQSVRAERRRPSHS
jgi:hypothetical protein